MGALYQNLSLIRIKWCLIIMDLCLIMLNWCLIIRPYVYLWWTWSNNNEANLIMIHKSIIGMKCSMIWGKWHSLAVLAWPDLVCYLRLFSNTRSLSLCSFFGSLYKVAHIYFYYVAVYLEFRYKFEINPRSHYVKNKQTNHDYKAIILCPQQNCKLIFVIRVF